MLGAYEAYRSVAHLWAALIHGGQHERKDIWPDSVATLPIFLSYADAILEIASRLPNPHRDRRFVLTPSEVWSFELPKPNSIWSLEDRAKWLRAAAIIFNLVYKPGEVDSKTEDMQVDLKSVG
jgi:hypothetical protein